MRLEALALAALSLGAAACSCKHPVPDPQAFEIGTGEERFQRADLNGVLIGSAGSGQGPGATHFWVAVGCTDCAGALVVSSSATDPDTGAELASPASSFREFHVCDQGGVPWGWVAGERLLRDDDAVSANEDADVLIHVEVTTEAGDLVGAGDLLSYY